MKLLLTSAGVKNPTISESLVEMLGRSIAECTALAIPTAAYGHPAISPEGARRFITGESSTPMCELGWRSVGILELTALPTLDTDRWQQWVRDADVLLVNGGEAMRFTVDGTCRPE